jgi:membrane-associated phospholipid phosphatase
MTMPMPKTTALEDADIAVAQQFAPQRDRPAMRAVSWFSGIGDSKPLLTVSGVVIAWGLLTGSSRTARQGGQMLSSVLLATVLKNGLKRAVARSRPGLLFERGMYDVELGGPTEKEWSSFPSGHAAASAAMAQACTRCWPEARVPAYLGAAVLGLSRVPLGKHYPTDVLAGVLVGLAAATLVGRVFARDGSARDASGARGSGRRVPDQIGNDTRSAVGQQLA